MFFITGTTMVRFWIVCKAIESPFTSNHNCDKSRKNCYERRKGHLSFFPPGYRGYCITVTITDGNFEFAQKNAVLTNGRDLI
jgi:hypothetical protein